MLHDEEREERERESRGVGEYAKGDPERATGSPATWAESVPAGIPKPDDWCEHCIAIRSCPPCLRSLLKRALTVLALQESLLCDDDRDLVEEKDKTLGAEIMAALKGVKP